MKIKQLILLISPLLMLGACKAIDPEQDFEEYDECVTYAFSNATGEGLATDYSNIKIIGDFSSGLYAVEFSDFKLLPSSPVETLKVRGLLQYLKEDEPDAANPDAAPEVLYAYFHKEGAASVEGNISVSDFNFGWLSTVFWGSFTANGNVSVWCLPREVETYANSNTVTYGPGNVMEENAISPRYDFEINASAATVTIHGSGITLPTDQTRPGESFIFRNLSWTDKPITFTPKGFESKIDRFQFSGDDGLYTVTDFSLKFDADYAGERVVEYKITQESTGTTVKVESKFDYFRKRN